MCVIDWVLKTSSRLQTVPSFGVRYTCDRDVTSPKSSSVARPYPIVRRASGRRAAFGIVEFSLSRTTHSVTQSYRVLDVIAAPLQWLLRQEPPARSYTKRTRQYTLTSGIEGLIPLLECSTICLSIARRRRSSRDLRVLRLISNPTSTKFRCRSQRRQCQFGTLYM